MASPISTLSSLPRRHVAVCPFPYSLQTVTLFLFCRKIVESAPNVDVSFFTTQASADVLANSRLADDCDDDVKIRIVDVEGLGPELLPQDEVRAYALGARVAFRRAMAAAEEDVGVKISCVVADAYLSFIFGEIVDGAVPKWVAVWTSSAADLATQMYEGDMSNRLEDPRYEPGQPGLQDGPDVDQFIAEFDHIPRDELAPEIIYDDLYVAYDRILHIMSHALPSASAVAINSFHPLEPSISDELIAAYGDIFFSCGPYCLSLAPPKDGTPEDRNDCLSWLDAIDKPESVLYICFGTVLCPPCEEIVALAEALEELKVPFLWSMPDPCKDDIPQAFVERMSRSGQGKVVPWAPQLAVLEHEAVGAHLTHCGWNSIMESVTAAVPMICRPFEVADQKFNEQLVVQNWGVGVELDTGVLTKESVTKAVKRVLMEEAGKQMKVAVEGMQLLAERATMEDYGSSVENLDKFLHIITS